MIFETVRPSFSVKVTRKIWFFFIFYSSTLLFCRICNPTASSIRICNPKQLHSVINRIANAYTHGIGIANPDERRQ